jgi:hypothetical protein
LIRGIVFDTTPARLDCGVGQRTVMTNEKVRQPDAGEHGRAGLPAMDIEGRVCMTEQVSTMRYPSPLDKRVYKL